MKLYRAQYSPKEKDKVQVLEYEVIGETPSAVEIGVQYSPTLLFKDDLDVLGYATTPIAALDWLRETLIKDKRKAITLAKDHIAAIRDIDKMLVQNY